MGGTKEGGRKAALTNKAKYGESFYSEIGKKGADIYNAIPPSQRNPRGFAYMKVNGQVDKIKAAGARGGATSRKVKKEKPHES